LQKDQVLGLFVAFRFVGEERSGRIYKAERQLLFTFKLQTTYRGCLDSRKWAEVRKWEVSFPTSVVHQTPEKENGKTTFPFVFSLLHKHVLTSKVLQLILWSC